MASCYNINVNEQDWITTTEAAEMTGYHVDYIRLLMREGLVVGRKFGTIWQVSQRSLQDYAAAAEKSKDGRRGPHSPA